MGIRVLEDGSIEADGISGFPPTRFLPEQAELLGINPLIDEGGVGFDEPVEPGPAAALVPPAPEEVVPDWAAAEPAVDVAPADPNAGLVDPFAAQAAEPDLYEARMEAAAQEGAAQGLAVAPAPGTGYEDTDIAYLDGERRIAASAGAMKEVADAQAEAGQEATRLLGEVEAERIITQEQQAAEIQSRTDQAQKEFADIRAEKEALSKAEPDQSRFWSSRSPLQQVAAMVGAMIQGYLRPGEPNTFVAAIMEQVNRDVALQERQIQRELDVLQQNAQSLGQEFDRDIAAMKMRFGLEAEKYESVKRFIDLAMQNENYRLAATRAKAEIERQEGLRQQAGALGVSKRRTDAEIRRQKQRLALAEARAKAADRRAKAAAGPTKNDLGETKSDLSVFNLYDKKTGKQVYFRNGVRPSELGELRAQQAAAEKSAGILTAILEAGPNSVIFNPRDDQKLIQENLVQQLHAAMRVALAGGGVTSDKDMALIQEIIPDPGAWLRRASWETRRKQLKNLLAGINAGVNAGLRSQGIIDSEFRATPLGVDNYKAQLRGDREPDDNIRLRSIPTVDEGEIADLAKANVQKRIDAAFASDDPKAVEALGFNPFKEQDMRTALIEERDRLTKEIRGQEARRRLGSARERDVAGEQKEATTKEYVADMKQLAKVVYGAEGATDEQLKKFKKTVGELNARGYDVPAEYLRDVGLEKKPAGEKVAAE